MRGQREFISRDVTICGINHQKCSVWSDLIQFINEFRLVVLISNAPKVIDTSSNHDDGLRTVFYRLNFGGGHLEPFSLWNFLVREQREARLDFRDRFSPLTLAWSPVLGDIIGGLRAGKHGTFNQSKAGWGSANVFGPKFQQEVSPRLIEDKGGSECYPTKVDPRPLVGFRGVQLTLHNAKLLAEYDGTKQSADGNHGGQNNHPSVASLYAIDKRLFGYGWLLLSAVGMLAGVFLLHIWDDARRTSFDWFNRSGFSRIGPRWRLVLGAILIGVAVISAWQGVGLICATTSGPASVPCCGSYQIPPSVAQCATFSELRWQS
jgi:hypothetical protein